MADSSPAGIEPKSFITRLITSAVFGVIVFGAILLGNKLGALPILCVIFCFIGAREFYGITSPDMARIPRALGTLFSMALPVVTVAARLNIQENPVLGTGGLAALIGLFYASAVALLAFLAWIAFTPSSKISDAALSYFGAVYVGIPLSFLILIREMNRGIVLAAMIVVSVWAADSFAYLGGSLFGRHKLAPAISPKKSWEGFIAGTAGSVLIWYIVPWFTHSSYGIGVALLIGTLVSTAALAGDLFESRIKREAGVKDSGTLLPGHGGILDRIDSMLSVSCILFLLISTVGVLLGVVTL